MTKLQNDILALLKEDARYGADKIAKMLGISEAEAKKEIGIMEENGVIVKYTVISDDEKAEKEDVEALIEVKVSPMLRHGFDSIAEDIYQFNEVKSVYLMSGTYDLLVIIEGKTLKEVARFVSEKLSVLENVISTATHFILKKYKTEGVCMKSSGINRQAVSA